MKNLTMDCENEPMVSDEWELSKENVLPLRQGRKMLNLTAALQSNDSDHHFKLQEEKRTFEAAITSYIGDDPLHIWMSYIKWIEQNFPKGGKDGNHPGVIESCLKTFNGNSQYVNDPRFLEIWLKYINFCKDPFEIFNFMYNQKICFKVAKFYESWAWELEKIGNLKAANNILNQGIACGAQPLEQLQLWQKKFDTRVAHRVVREFNNPEMPMEMEEQRTILGALKPMGKKHIVGSQRIGPAKSAVRSGLNIHVSASQQRGQAFKVFSENEPSSNSSIPQDDGQWTYLASREESVKENEKKAGPWNRVKAFQKNVGVVSFNQLSERSKPFTIHLDENIVQPIITPHKIPEVSQVLSARKLDKPANPLAPFTQREVENPNVRIMHCKEKLFNGVQEMSLEELRAIRYSARKQREKEKTEQLIFQHNMEKKYEDLMNKMIELQKEWTKLREAQQDFSLDRLQREKEVQQQMEEVQEETMLLNATIVREQMKNVATNFVLSSHNHQKPAHSDESITCPTTNLLAALPAMTTNYTKSKEIQDHSVILPNSVEDKPEISTSISFSNLKFSQTNHSLPPPFEKSQNSTKSSNQVQDFNSVDSHQQIKISKNDANPIIQLSEKIESDHAAEDIGTNNSLSRTLPSPTIVTKEAMGLMQALWNDPKLEENLGWNVCKSLCKEDRDFEAAFANDDVFSLKPDKNSFPEVQKKEKTNKMLTFTIHEDAEENLENKPPENYLQPKEKRKLAGILQPAIDIPTQPIDDKENFMSATDQNDDLEDCIPLPNADNTDFTIIPPANQMEFAAAARHASTPFNHGTFVMPSIIFTSANAKHYTNNTISSQSNESSPNEADSINSHNPLKTTVAAPYVDLSIILETSRDCKTSSSSSSSNSTVSSVKSNNHCPSGSSRSLSQGATLAEEFHKVNLSEPNVLKITDNFDPFDEDLHLQFISNLNPPLSSYPGYVTCRDNLPHIQVNRMITLGKEVFFVKKLIGKGAYAKIYEICKTCGNQMLLSSGAELALKVQKAGCPWEFYITSQIQKRLAVLDHAKDCQSSILRFDAAYTFHEDSCFLSSVYRYGTLLDMGNQYKKSNSPFPEELAMLFTIEILYIVEQLHKCQIIHGDIKPDNFMLQDISNYSLCDRTQKMLIKKGRLLLLIDFGRSIDMKLFPLNTTFNHIVKTSGFQCVEMKTNKPWIYQPDLFGILGSVHCLLFGDYMNPYKSGERWKITSNFKRIWQNHLWRPFFDDFLNIPDCDHLPDLASYREKFENHLMNENEKGLEAKFLELVVKLHSHIKS